jgi:hypothetical protein
MLVQERLVHTLSKTFYRSVHSLLLGDFSTLKMSTVSYLLDSVSWMNFALLSI